MTSNKHQLKNTEFLKDIKTVKTAQQVPPSDMNYKTNTSSHPVLLQLKTST